MTSEGWERWIRVRSRNGLARYSVNNQLLIALARPDATFVAGFRSWLELGYQVRKGEKAVWILAPLKIKDRDRISGEETGEARVLFRAVPVFDRAQVTAGEHAMPLEPPCEPLSGDSHEHLLETLERFAGSLGFAVSFETIDGSCGGWCDHRRRRIVVDADEAANAKVRVLIHELAHALVRHDRQPDDPVLDYSGEEPVAESVAYTCLGALGVSSEDYSIPYLASWAESSDLEVLEHTACLIDRLARKITRQLRSQDHPPAAPARSRSPTKGLTRPLSTRRTRSPTTPARARPAASPCSESRDSPAHSPRPACCSPVGDAADDTKRSPRPSVRRPITSMRLSTASERSAASAGRARNRPNSPDPSHREKAGVTMSAREPSQRCGTRGLPAAMRQPRQAPTA